MNLFTHFGKLDVLSPKNVISLHFTAHFADYTQFASLSQTFLLHTLPHSSICLSDCVSVLGTGGIIYDLISIVAYFGSPNQCQSAQDLIHPMTEILFILLQVILLLNYAKVHTGCAGCAGICFMIIV